MYKNLLRKMQSEEPDRNVVFVAIERIKDKNQIRTFFKQYVDFLGKSVENPKEVAQSNIGYVLGYYSRKTADRWMEALPEAIHPIFGRDIPWNDSSKAC